MPRAADSGWGKAELATARELARMWEGKFHRMVKSTLTDMAVRDESLYVATVATMVDEIAEGQHRDSFLRFLRKQVRKAQS